MNSFHIFRKFRKISKNISPIQFKYRHISSFSGICREIPTKFHQNFAENNAKFDAKNWKNSIHFFIREKMLTIVGWNFEIWAVQKYINLVDLVKSFPTRIYLQKSASIQTRTSLSKFGGKFNSLFIRLLSIDAPAGYARKKRCPQWKQFLSPECLTIFVGAVSKPTFGIE